MHVVIDGFKKSYTNNINENLGNWVQAPVSNQISALAKSVEN